MRVPILLNILLICLAGNLSAKQILVTSPSQVSARQWEAGDTLLLANGTYADEVIRLQGTGTADAPIVLIAQTAGEATFTGSSRLEMAGSYLVVDGFYWYGGALTSGKSVVAFRTDSEHEATHSTLRNCAIVDYNPADEQLDYKWVSLYGQDNRVERCSFQNKHHLGTLLVVWLSEGQEARHVIARNYFGERTSILDTSGKEINGQEIIRVGDSSTSMTSACVTVEGNLFDSCDGEIETISNKSCGNTYSNNLFLSCAGTLTLRHGNGCTVDGNYFLGNGKANTGGVRIIGENHLVCNNYFEGLTGTGYRAALTTVRGIVDSPLSGYYQVKDARVVCNTFVNCRTAIQANYGSTQTLLAENAAIALNLIYNNSASYVLFQSDGSSFGFTIEKNLYNAGKLEESVDGFTKSTQLKMKRDSTDIYVPASGSAAYLTLSTGYGEVTHDLKGNNRTGYRCAGAVQTPNGGPLSMPSEAQVGARWLTSNHESAIITPAVAPSVLACHGRRICIDASALDSDTSLYLSFFDSNGQLVHRCHVTQSWVDLPESMTSYNLLFGILTNSSGQRLGSVAVPTRRSGSVR